MKNKKSLIILLITIILFSIFMVLNIYEYHNYTNIYNQKLATIITNVKEKYPKISEDEILKIINKKNNNSNFLKKYGIYEKDFLIKETKNTFYKYLITNSLVFGLILLIIYLLFYYKDYKTNQEIKKITKYIEALNHKNYSLAIDDINEGELSILKNEIYKTTIMLREIADNSLNDKLNLKKSLEDISHQLKTPLTSILVLLDNLIDDTKMDLSTRLDFYTNIKREITNMNFLIQSLLKLSKFDVNTIKFNPANYKVNQIIDASIKNVSLLCELKKVKINVNYITNIKLYCDYHWQIEALTNILKNCIEHSLPDSVINIDYQENNAYVLIKIEDFGKGISKKDLPHIFERFYKGRNSSYDSIGIGLALAKVIIEKDNGKITVESNKKGTKFFIKYFKI